MTKENHKVLQPEDLRYTLYCSEACTILAWIEKCLYGHWVVKFEHAIQLHRHTARHPPWLTYIQ